MSWFGYIKIGEQLPSTNYKYGNLKRKISFSTIKQNLIKDSWVFVDLLDHKIDNFIDSQLTEVVDDRSYIVVYENESENSKDFVCVNSKIIGNLLYFQIAENHTKNEEIAKQYSLYYKTKKIKNIKSIINNGTKEYQEVLEENSDFLQSTTVSQNVLTNVHPQDIGYYSFSFLNQNIDWKENESFQIGAKVSGMFTGPNFLLNCEKGPDCGMIKLTILSVKNEATPENIIIENNLIIDLYSSSKSNEDVYIKNDLPRGEYIFEATCDAEKNVLSKSNKVKVNSFSYSLDQFLKLEEEEISPYLLTKNILGVS